MAATPAKSQPLHNFSFPFLKWGEKNQTNTGHRSRRPVTSGDSSPPLNATAADQSCDSKAEFDNKGDLVGSRNHVRLSSNFPGEESQKQPHSEKESNDETEDEVKEKKKKDAGEAGKVEAEETVQKPWNLRPRKPLFPKGMFEIVRGGTKYGEFHETVAEVTANHSVQPGDNPPPPKSMRLRGSSDMRCTERREKRIFWIALSKEEIEEDIFAMTGSRPSRRPRKRPKNVQKHLDNVFPGLWLVGTTADSYRVPETPSKVKMRIHLEVFHTLNIITETSIREVQFIDYVKKLGIEHQIISVG